MYTCVLLHHCVVEKNHFRCKWILLKEMKHHFSLLNNFLFVFFSLQLQGSEGANIARCFKGKDFSAFMAGGIHVEGTKYQFLREEDGKLVLAKKKEHGAITLQASKTAIVIAHCPEGGQQGNTNKGVSVIAEYLESLGM